METAHATPSPASVDPDWIETALHVTGDFETAGDAFAAIAGDFDGQGISCGVLQWNIGQGTLQPLVRSAGEACVAAHMPEFGARLWQAANRPIGEGLAIVRAWQEGTRLPAAAKRELAAFLESPESRRAQIAAASHIAGIAHSLAAEWERGRGAPGPDKRNFCWFFDLVVQNGGLKGLSLADVRQFIAEWGQPNAGDAICDWLVARGRAHAGYGDSRRNAQLWRNAFAPGDIDLFILSYLRSLKSSRTYRGVVLNRKGTIAFGKGWVNGALNDLTPYFPPASARPIG